MNKLSDFKFIKIRHLFLLLSLFFFQSASQADSLFRSIQNQLIKKDAKMVLLFKIQDREKQVFEIKMLESLVQIKSGASWSLENGIYLIDLLHSSIVRKEINHGFFGLFSEDIPKEFKTTKFSKNIFEQHSGLADDEAEKIMASLINFSLVWAEKEHRKEYQILKSRHSKNQSSIQSKIYFLVGYLQPFDVTMHEFVYGKIHPYLETLNKKGFNYVYQPYAKTEDLISALNDEETLAIYWIGHSLNDKDTKTPYILDADRNIVPYSVFTRNFRSRPISLALIACYPEKLSDVYGIGPMNRDRSMTAWYSEEANFILKETVIRPIDFNNYLNTLPQISLPGEATSGSSDYRLLNFEVANYFPQSNKFYILLNGKYLSTVPFNYSTNFEKFSVQIPKKFFGTRNKITIYRESSGLEKIKSTEIYIRNISLVEKESNAVIFNTKTTFKLGIEGLLTLFSDVKSYEEKLNEPVEINF